MQNENENPTTPASVRGQESRENRGFVGRPPMLVEPTSQWDVGLFGAASCQPGADNLPTPRAARGLRGLFLGQPVSDPKVFFDLTAFVPVLVGFVGAAFDVPELMFRISDQFGQDLRSFAHGFIYLPSKTEN